MKNSLARRLEYLLANLGIKQQDFAKRVDFTQSYISQILKGSKANPSSRFYEAVCREFSVNIKWLYEGEGKVYTIPGQDLPSLDAELLAKYRLLPRTEKRMIDEIINALLVKNMSSKE
ncbi:MAG: helix-turn-helix domain-containing protein [Treponema sp.]|nr:helix-turn-helix domain-containing protein [Treponema sp.]